MAMRPYFDAPPVALAHRGGALYPPNVGLENTAAAFGRAVALGYRYLETDVHVTSDGTVVALHDDRLDRVADRPGRIADLTWQQVRRARVGGVEPVPALDDLLGAFPETRFNIDLKTPAAVGPTWRLIERHRAHDRVCVGSFTNRTLWHYRRVSRGRTATAAGRLGTAWLRLGPAGLARAGRTPADVLQIPVRFEVAGRVVEVVTADLLARAHALGRQVHVWTVDDPAEMTRLLDLGVDGLVSDAIDVLRDVLRARGQW